MIYFQSGNIDIPVPQKSIENISYPEIQINPEYNPFESGRSVSAAKGNNKGERSNLNHWEDMYKGTQLKIKPEEQRHDVDESDLFQGFTEQFSGKKFLQLKQKYILTPVKSGLMIIDQKRAHERILFEQFMEVLKSESMASQQQLFPHTIELNPAEAEILKDISEDLHSLGFDIREFGTNTFIINGTPGMLDVSSPVMIIEKLLEEYKNSPVDTRLKVKEKIAHSLAKASAIDYGTDLSQEQIDQLIDNLFACATPNFSPDGKRVLTIIPTSDIERSFNK